MTLSDMSISGSNLPEYLADEILSDLISAVEACAEGEDGLCYENILDLWQELVVSRAASHQTFCEMDQYISAYFDAILEDMQKSVSDLAKRFNLCILSKELEVFINSPQVSVLPEKQIFMDGLHFNYMEWGDQIDHNE